MTMARDSRTFLIVTLLIVLIALAAACRRERPNESRVDYLSPPLQAQAAQKPAQGSQPPTAERKLPTSLPPNHKWNVPPPTARWMTAPPKPLTVTPQPSAGLIARQEITPGGGEISATSKSGTRFTLRIPPRALTENVKLELQPIDTIDGFPAAAPPLAAVQIRPANIRWWRSPVLVVEPRRRAPNEGAPTFSAFAVNASNELFLAPSLHREEMVGATTQDRYVLPLADAPVLGLATLTRAEIEALHSRTPTALGDRITEAMAYGQATSAKPQARTTGGWLPVLYAQSQADAANLPEWVAAAVQQLREYYDQQLMPKVNALSDDCKVTNQQESVEIEAEIAWWNNRTEVLGLTEDEDSRMPPEEIAKMREMYPALAEDAAQRNAYFEGLRREFQQRESKLVDAFLVHLKARFDRTHECCLRNPEAWMADVMLKDLRTASLWNEGLLGEYAMLKIQECRCKSDAVTGNGRSWTGEIRQTEMLDTRKSQEQNGRTVNNVLKVMVDARLVMLGDDGGKLVAAATINGTRHAETHEVLPAGSGCLGTRKKDYGVDATLSGISASDVQISITPDNAYRISFLPLTARGLSLEREQGSLDRACNPAALKAGNYSTFNTKYASVAMKSVPISGISLATTLLQGSKETVLPGNELGTPDKYVIKQTWRLAACAQ